MSISASLVMQLRERTGAGMMECKKFLTETNGDIEQAIIAMRKAGQAKSDKKADRVAAEGIIVIAKTKDNHAAVMLEINSETDFVARDQNFIDFATAVSQTALSARATDLDTLTQLTLLNTDTTIAAARQELIIKLGENIQLRRIKAMFGSDTVGHYLHSNKIGVLVAMRNGNEELAKNIAMHIAASRPLVVTREQISPEIIANEREIFTAQARESGKPVEVIDKMIEGRINKFMDEVSLLGQIYVKDPTKKISQLLTEANASVIEFARFAVGEGIEKKENNFVTEVMAQVRDR